MCLAFSLRPFRIVLHLTFEVKYIDVNVHGLSGLERNLVITTTTLPGASGKGRLITLWTLSGLVVLAFVFVGGGKLAGTAVMVALFDKVGLGQWFRYFTGFLEVAGGISLLIPRYAFYAAVLLALVMVGAIITHVTIVGGSFAPAAVLLVLSGIIAWLRKP
jgi:putative oxidoreductase